MESAPLKRTNLDYLRDLVLALPELVKTAGYVKPGNLNGAARAYWEDGSRDLESALRNFVEAFNATDSPLQIAGGGLGAVARAGVVRVWAREQGYEVADFGAIPGHVRAAYDLAHPSTEAAPHP